jgi:hypothetical protein
VTSGVVVVAVIWIVGGAVFLWKRLGGNGELRESIDIDAVIDAKYPNRASIGVLTLDDEPDPELEAQLQQVLEPASPVMTAARRDVVVDLLHGDEPPVPAHSAFVASGFPAPLPNVGPNVPIPGEPVDLPLAEERAENPPVPTVRIDPGGDPFEQLKRRRDRVAAQAAATFREVHKLRTEALRRASQAEHNASLAANARTRAGRMVRDTRRNESHGRRRPTDIPSSDDAYGDVHHFRTEALKRAQQAEHGAQRVAQARERAARLLAEQRELEAEMAKLQKLRTPTAPG